MSTEFVLELLKEFGFPSAMVAVMCIAIAWMAKKDVALVGKLVSIQTATTAAQNDTNALLKEFGSAIRKLESSDVSDKFAIVVNRACQMLRSYSRRLEPDQKAEFELHCKAIEDAISAQP